MAVSSKNIRIFFRFRKKYLRARFVFGMSALLLLVAFTALPLVYVISTAFKPMDELYLFPPRFFVRNPVFANFEELFVSLGSSVVPFWRYVINSVFTAGASVFLSVWVCCMGAYALAKLPFPARNTVFLIIVASMMFSPHVTKIPTYMVVNGLGLFNNYMALIIPNIAVGGSLFLVKQFAEQMPNELLEAARIDGANEWTLFRKIAMPFLRPAWSTLIVFSFVANWNDYFSPLIFTSKDVMKTMPLVLQTIGGGAGAASLGRAGAVAAATFLMTMPTVVVFTVMQSKVVQTMAHAGIKG